MTTCLEDFPTELFLSIFDHLWAHELFHSFSHLNTRIEQIILGASLHVSSATHPFLYVSQRVLSLNLTSLPSTLDVFTNLRSLTLIQCNLDDLHYLPSRLSRLCIENIDLSPANIKLILENRTLTNVQLNLHHRITIFSSIIDIQTNANNIRYLTINYATLNDIIELLQYTPHLKYLHVSLIGGNAQTLTKSHPLPTVKRLTCLSMGVPFDQLCFRFLAVHFPNVRTLSIFTSLVDNNQFINSIQQLLTDDLLFVNNLLVSVQVALSRTTNNNIEAIAARFRTAFWLKRNCRATFKCCNDGSRTIRIYLQTNKKTRARPSRF